MDNYPEEFTDIHQRRPNDELAECCDKLFELFNSVAADSNKKKGYVWPLQIMLLILCPKILEEIVNADSGAPCSPQHIRKVGARAQHSITPPSSPTVLAAAHTQGLRTC